MGLSYGYVVKLDRQRWLREMRQQRLNLAREKSVPGDCSVLVIAHPIIPPLPVEIAAIDRYLQHGGKSIVMVDPAPGAGLEKFFDRWGLRVGDDVIMDVSGAGRPYGSTSELAR